MIIYKDCVSGDEMFSDIYKMTLLDGVIYEVDGKLTSETSEVDESAFGFNASAEGGNEPEVDERAGTKSGCNIVLANRLVETSYDKKGYQKYMKEYMKNILGHLEKTNPERIAVFKQAAKRQVQKILDTFKDWQFFLGESSDQDGMVALMNFREDGVTPYMLFWKDGLVEEKV